MDCSFRELECFIAVAEELSFTRAAKRLNLAQPPLSRHIRTLEEKIGAPLFERNRQGVSMTAAGNTFYEETRNILPRLRRAGESALRSASGQTASLRLGFVSAVMNEHLAGILRRFRKAHPEVRIMLHDVAPKDQIAAIADGRLDGGFIGLAPADPPAGIRFIGWMKEPLVCLVPSDHPLAERKSVALKDLAEEPFVAVSHGSAPAFSDHVRELCSNAGFRQKVILESPRAQAVALMVAAGSGIALLPSALSVLVKDSARALPIRPAAPITHVFACREGRSPDTLGPFLKLLR